MFTNWDQIENWIRDNQFVHWVFYEKNPNESGDKDNIKIADSNYYTGDFEDKIAMTKKYIILNGGVAFGAGFKTPNATQGGTVCKVRLEAEAPAAPVGGIGYTQQTLAEMRESLRKELQAEWDKKEYERLRKDLDRERKEFEAEKNSAIGILTNYLAPVGKALLQRNKVAGVDASAPVTAEPVQPIKSQEPAEPEQPEEESPFTDEEADKLFDLMARFKKVEPQYMQLLEAVVTMAENGDSTYTMAKGFLIKE